MSANSIRQALCIFADRARLEKLLYHRKFETVITVLIGINAITLGLETSEFVMSKVGSIIHAFDKFVLAVFTAELLAKLYATGGRFFRSGWNWFDAVIVTISLLPASGSLSVLRALRILRILRLISVVPTLRRVVGALIEALPGMGSVVVLMGLVFYVFSVMATKLFGEAFPQWFGSVGGSAYSLFQIMTLESWSMGIVRPVMESFPLAWAFFVPFILCTSFVVLNLFIGIIVSSMQADIEEEANEGRAALHDQNAAILHELKSLRGELAEFKKNK